MKIYTSEQLIASIQRRGGFSPSAQSEGKADQDLLDVADEVLLEELVPAILKHASDYLVRTVTLSITATPNLYALPKRAVGNALRDVSLQESNGATKYLILVSRDLLPYYPSGPGTPDGFYFEGDRLVLVPAGSGGTLRVSFAFRPGQLVKADSYRRVVSVDSPTSVTLDSAVPPAWSTATLFDVHSPASGAEVRVFDYGASVVAGTAMTFTQLIDGTVDATRAVEVGDYVVEAEHAAIPALPRDAHPVLAQAAACRLLESDGDSEMLKLGRETLGRMYDNFAELFETRVTGKQQRFVNRRSLLFGQSWR